MALAPIGAAAAASSSALFSRYSSTTTNQKINQVTTQKMNAIARSHFSSLSNSSHYGARFCGSNNASFPRFDYQTRLKSSIAKEAAENNAPLTTAKSSSGGFVKWYEGYLNSRPVTTKAITGSILWGIGDFVAQVVPTMFQDDSSLSDSDEAVTKKDFKYDYPRTARAVVFGFAIHAPLSHVHFNFLEWMTVKGGFTGLSIPVFKTVMEQVSLVKCKKFDNIEFWERFNKILMN